MAQGLAQVSVGGVNSVRSGVASDDIHPLWPTPTPEMMTGQKTAKLPIREMPGLLDWPELAQSVVTSTENLVVHRTLTNVTRYKL
jgi:hypothetical protein